MKIEELKNEGLKRHYQISIPSASIAAAVEADITERARTFKIPGFREGKVPLSIVRRHIGTDALSKQIEKRVNGAINKLFKEKDIQPALQPKIEIISFDKSTDLVFSIEVEGLPVLPTIDWSKIDLEEIQIQLTPEETEVAEQHFAQMIRSFTPAPEGYKACLGDTLSIKFSGIAKERDFTNGIQELQVNLGSGTFIAEIEEQLIGVEAGETRIVSIQLPEDYQDAELAGQTMQFDITVEHIKQAGEPIILNDELAKSLGLTDLQHLKEIISQRVAADLAVFSRMRTKRILFDKIDAICDFHLPTNMVEADFKSIMEEAKQKPGYDEEDEIDTYMSLARRRVKLGIILAEMAKIHGIAVTAQDIQQEFYSQVARLPNKEKEIKEFFSNPENVEKLKGPVLEEKTVDFILSQINLTTKKVSSKEFTEFYLNSFSEEPKIRSHDKGFQIEGGSLNTKNFSLLPPRN